jgi:hypothetical protein
MRRAAAMLALLALLAHNADAAPAQQPTQDIVLALPHPLGAGETAFIEVQVGAVGAGREIGVTTASGQELGVISPFGVRAGQDAGTYTLPVPNDAIRDGRVAIRLTITGGGTARAPTAQEVRSVKLKIGAGPR